MKRLKYEDAEIVATPEFNGIMQNGVKQGHGTEFCDGVVRFQGIFRKGLRHGFGVFYRPDGTITLMSNFSNGRTTGVVKAFNALMSPIYSGHIRGDRLYGTHCYSLQEENVKVEYEYNGSMSVIVAEDVLTTTRNGCGLLKKNGKLFYEGTFQDDEFHGSGKLYGDHLIYNGEFLHGLMTGRGKYYHSADLFTQCMFINGVANGLGLRRCLNAIHFEGVFEDGKYKNGRLYCDDGSYFTGDFSEGVPIDGRIVRDNFTEYEGSFCPNRKLVRHGRGKVHFQNGTAMSCMFKNNKPEGDVDIWSGDKLIFTGTLDNSLGNYEFYNSTMFDISGRVQFKGSVCMDFKSGDIRYLDGELYVNGFKRIVGDFLNNFFDELYDENGVIMLKDPKIWNDENEVQMNDFDDNGWPRNIGGYWSVFDENGAFMYEALFRDGAITNPFAVASKTPVAVFHSAVDDMISLEPIELNTIVYFLNQNPASEQETKHVISGSTMRKMKACSQLKVHPYTRVPIVRLRRARFMGAVEKV
jgi:antitoxin component YwqK of YwqJK toxin-antitoxin module